MTNTFNVKKLLTVSNAVFWTAIVIATLCATLVYGYSEYFTIAQQVVLHIGTIIFPAVFKVGYVLRLVAQNELGMVLQ